MYEIRMAHPAKNALSNDLMGWLEQELAAAGQEPVLLIGTGDAFCAGLNLVEFAGLEPPAVEAFVRRVDELAMRLYQHPAPVVAAANGHAIAGGCVLLAACDYRVATTNPRTRIGLNEVALGVCFPPKIRRMLELSLPRERLDELLLGAGLYAPEEALRLGLVDELADDPEAAARERLTKWSAHPASAYARTKGALHDVRLTPEDVRAFEEVELPIWRSEDVRRRVLAALGK